MTAVSCSEVPNLRTEGKCNNTQVGMTVASRIQSKLLGVQNFSTEGNCTKMKDGSTAV